MISIFGTKVGWGSMHLCFFFIFRIFFLSHGIWYVSHSLYYFSWIIYSNGYQIYTRVAFLSFN